MWPQLRPFCFKGKACMPATRNANAEQPVIEKELLSKPEMLNYVFIIAVSGATI